MAPAASMSNAQAGFGAGASDMDWNRCVGMPKRGRRARIDRARLQRLQAAACC